MFFRSRFLYAVFAALVLTASQAAVAAGPGVTISQTGPALTATLSNGGTAGLNFNYASKSDCAGQTDIPCFQFHSGNGTAPISVSAGPCKVVDSSAVECPATGVGAVLLTLKNGGSTIVTCDSGACSGGGCFSGLTVKAQSGKGDVYSIRTVDGCSERVMCAGSGLGTVEADAADRVTGCKFVQRQTP